MKYDYYDCMAYTKSRGTKTYIYIYILTSFPTNRISKLVARAEDTRRQREAEESGTRQAEQDLRRREEAVYGELMKLHQLTTDSYLNEVVREAVDGAASDTASREMRVMRGGLAPSISRLEDERNTADVVVRDVVSSFLMPEVQRTRARRDMASSDRRFAEAAEYAAKEAFDQVASSAAGGFSGSKK